MNSEDKDKVIDDFSKNQIKVLISTTVLRSD
ncbi:MAG: hypothetical protein CM15mP44_7160 [Candidatus Neomarinimicrobiota bacterium]|nr:MAG: hypothetical protein CM15mP44_7160 [Candidatus Neomarinimicrobiota bacterium]